VFEENVAMSTSREGACWGGAISCFYDSNPVFNDCLIRNNVAELGGGVVIAENACPVLNRCEILSNHATFSDGGGGIKCMRFFGGEESGHVKLNACVLMGNLAEEYGGAIQCWDESSAELTNSLVVGNMAEWGAGISVSASSPLVLSSCTFSENFARQDYGDSVFCYLSTAQFSNTSFDLVSFTVSGDSEPICGVDPIYHVFEEPGFVRRGVFDFDRLRILEIGGENFTLPDFIVDPGDYRLQAGSAMIDAGATEEAPPDDILGNPRPCGAAADVGAYEFQSGDCLRLFRRGDVDGTGTVQLTDAVYILNHLFLAGRAPSCPDAADADDNGTLELTDAVRILRYLFLASSPPEPPGPTDCGPDPTADGLPLCEDSGC
jgi:hypothetical protein